MTVMEGWGARAGDKGTLSSGAGGRAIPRFDPCDHRKQKIDPFSVNIPALRTGQLLEQAI